MLSKASHLTGNYNTKNSQIIVNIYTIPHLPKFFRRFTASFLPWTTTEKLHDGSYSLRVDRLWSRDKSIRRWESIT